MKQLQFKSTDGQQLMNIEEMKDHFFNNDVLTKEQLKHILGGGGEDEGDEDEIIGWD